VHYDYDWLVIGSGFGGSVSALRLAQKGYKVGVLECGRRFADDELPKSTWDVRKYWYAPKLGLNGIFRLTIFKDVAIASGSGVGGGSLGYANTLYRAPARFYEDAQWAGLNDWLPALAPHYEEAERMLGVTTYDEDDPADDYLREYAEEIGVGGTYAKTRVGVFLGERGKTVADPFFGGDGPDRTGCIRCGRCMVGCPYGAKNTLVKNYLWFAERAGVRVMPERTVVDIKPLAGGGYAVTSTPSGLRRGRQTLAAWSSRRARSAPTGCWRRAGSTARCRTSRRGSASSCGPTPRRSSR
jgi:cholesterol oxidase